MPFEDVNYRLRWTGSGPAVEINDGEGVPKILKDAALVQTVRRIRGSRRKFSSEAAWRKELGIYEGALAYLHQQLRVEERR